MTTCKHCGREIFPVNWYDGPGWIHGGSGRTCRPVTIAEPEDVPNIVFSTDQ